MILLLLSLTIIRAADPYGNDVSGEGRFVLSGKSLKVAVQVQEEGKPLGETWVYFKAHNGSLTLDSVLTDQSGFASVEFIPEENGWVEGIVNNVSVKIHPGVIPKGGFIKLLLSIITGTILILMGLDNTNKGFSRFSGEKVRQLLWKMTGRPIFAYVTGIFLAIFMESSTMTGLMLLGLLESSLMKLSTGLIVLCGAALGSTFTVQIIATDIIQFSPILILIGYLLLQSKSKWSYIGRILLGFGLIFFSIWLIRESINPFVGIFTLDLPPLILFLISILLTLLFHSSAATLGLLIGFIGVINFSSIIPIILGANIGTTFTILLGSTRFSSSGRALGVGYFILKSLFIILSIYILFIPKNIVPVTRDIANIHTLVNIWGLACIPLCLPLSIFLKRVIRGRGSRIRLDSIYLSSPSIAISKCHESVRESMKVVHEMFKTALIVFKSNNNALRKMVIKRDDEIDKNQEDLTSYSSRLFGKELSDLESNKCITLLKIMSEIEHIGDLISKNFMAYAGKKIKESYYFSIEGFKEIKEYHRSVLDNLEEIEAALSTMDKDIARAFLERQIESLRKLDRLRESHLNRLKLGKPESIDTSTLHLDILNDCDRINLHIYNIGKAIVGKL